MVSFFIVRQYDGYNGFQHIAAFATKQEATVFAQSKIKHWASDTRFLIYEIPLGEHGIRYVSEFTGIQKPENPWD